MPRMPASAGIFRAQEGELLIFRISHVKAGVFRRHRLFLRDNGYSPNCDMTFRIFNRILSLHRLPMLPSCVW